MAALVTKLAPKPAPTFTAKGRLRIVASSPIPDFDGEVVEPSTLRLDVYKSNPMVLAYHDRNAPPIAKAEDSAGNFCCQVDDRGRLIQEWTFAPTAIGREFELLYREKFLRGASIGFTTDGTERIPSNVAMKSYGVNKSLSRHTGGVLLETSAVPVPCNSESLADRWMDVEKAARAVSRGYYSANHPVSGLVVKTFKPYLPTTAKTFLVGSGSGFPTKKASSTHTKRTPAVEKDMDPMMDTDTTTVPDAPVEDAGDTDHKEHLINAATALLSELKGGTVSLDEVKKKLQDLLTMIGGEEEPAEPVEGEEVEETEEAPEDDESEKSFDQLVEKTVKGLTAKQDARIDQIAAQLRDVAGLVNVLIEKVR